MFTTLIVQPIFNLLVFIYAILPGHNFGLSLIIFTIIIRLLLWPIVKRQIRHTQSMQSVQPEIKKIKQATKGDRQKEQLMTMELYKERGINIFATFPVLIVQAVILIGLYLGLRRVISNPHAIISFAYPGLQHLSWMRELSHNIHLFDNSLFGAINLNRSALGHGGGIYLPGMVIVIGSAVSQYFQSKQMLPKKSDRRSLRAILKEAGSGKQADQAEVNAAVGQSTVYLIPFMIFIFTVGLPCAFSLYWFTGGIVAYIQQGVALRRGEAEMETNTDKPATNKNLAAIPEAEVVAQVKTASKPNKSFKKTNNKTKKRTRK